MSSPRQLSSSFGVLLRPGIVTASARQSFQFIEDIGVRHACRFAFAFQSQLNLQRFIEPIQRAQSPSDHPVRDARGVRIAGTLAQHRRPLKLNECFVVSLQLVEGDADVVAQ